MTCTLQAAAAFHPAVQRFSCAVAVLGRLRFSPGGLQACVMSRENPADCPSPAWMMLLHCYKDYAGSWKQQTRPQWCTMTSDWLSKSHFFMIELGLKSEGPRATVLLGPLSMCWGNRHTNCCMPEPMNLWTNQTGEMFLFIQYKYSYLWLHF